MDTESLFVEEAEPPGSLTGMVGLTQQHDLTSPPIAHGSAQAVTARPAARSAAWNTGRTRAFRKRFFPHTTLKEWQDWQWQLRHRIRDAETLGRMIRLSDDEQRAMKGQAGLLPLAITP